MARLVSLVVLAGTVVLFGFLSFEVLSSFWLPMFIALLLVVTFRPVHRWFLKRCGKHDRVAAGLTTFAILVIVLLPMSLILIAAATELARMITPLAGGDLADVTNRIQKRLDLELPPQSISKNLEAIRGTVVRLRRTEPDQQEDDLIGLRQWLADLERAVQPVRDGGADGNEGAAQKERRADLLAALDRVKARGLAVVDAANRWQQALAALPPDNQPPTAEAAQQAAHAREEFQFALDDAMAAVDRFQDVLYGGPVMEWIKKQIAANKDEFIKTLPEKISAWAGPLALGVPQYLGSVIFDTFVGALILVVAMYYFFADGAGMIDSVVRLSPLDDRYQKQLLEEFDNVSRAVIVSMLLAAFAQGLLAGVGYWVVGFNSVLLLTVVTMLFAMVPFVGGAVIWGGCCLWLVIDGRPYAALGLAVYCTVVVSTADNVVKPYVLHGRSNLHPLLGLLSVLGGAKALGAIGLVVGPMIVVFLQTLLVMLRSELSSMDEKRGNDSPQAALAAISGTSEKPPPEPLKGPA